MQGTAARGLDAISAHPASTGEEAVNALRGKPRIGVHLDVEVTDGEVGNRPVVSQAFCSAVPVAYGRVLAVHWKSFASVVLEAAYEATLPARSRARSAEGRASC